MEKQKLEQEVLELKEPFKKFGMKIKRVGRNYIRLDSNPPFNTTATYLPKKGTYLIQIFFIDEEYQKNGYSREIITTIETLAKRLGTKKGKVVTNQNPEFWEHFGYFSDTKELN